MNYFNHPLQKEVPGQIKLIEYFFSRTRAVLSDYAACIKLINGEPPKVIIRKSGAVVVKIDSGVKKRIKDLGAGGFQVFLAFGPGFG